jgi:OOP family OmpA-OmpF porin
MKIIKTLLAGMLCFTIPSAAVAQQKDATGCQDHALLTRMPTFWIRSCPQSEFDAFVFVTGQGKTERIEGKTTKLSYYPQATATSKPSAIQVLRNYENAVKALGGTVVATTPILETFKVAKDGKEFWIQVSTGTGAYFVTIVERAAMAQDIVANADVFSSGLKATGHIAVYGILFDVAKSDIKPESESAIGEIAKLLKAEPALKLYVVGHTDAVGSVDANLKLSQDRAEAVLQALVRTHGIAAARLKSFGNGPFAPVATNDSDEGRAKNRRVELVKQ